MKNEQADVIQEQFEKDKFLENQFAVLSGNTGLQYESENFLLADCEVKQSTGETTVWKSVIGDKPKLIFRYTESHCNSCVEHSLNMLAVYKEYIEDENILILATGKNLARLRIYLEKYKLDNIQVLYTLEQTNIPIERYDFPYFYILNSDMKTQLVFLPIKEIPDLTKRYLDIIHLRFLDKTI